MTIPSPPHVVAFRFSGPPEPTAGEAIYAALDAATREHAEVALYVEIGWVYGLTPEDFVAGVRRGLARLGAESRVRRIAVVSGDYGRRTLVRREATDAEGLQVEVFPVGVRAMALEWAAVGGTPRTYVA